MMKPNLDDMKIITIVKQAGETIMQIYKKDFGVEYKEDQSPLTEADLASHHLICDELIKLYQTFRSCLKNLQLFQISR